MVREIERERKKIVALRQGGSWTPQHEDLVTVTSALLGSGIWAHLPGEFRTVRKLGVRPAGRGGVLGPRLGPWL